LPAFSGAIPNENQLKMALRKLARACERRLVASVRLAAALGDETLVLTFDAGTALRARHEDS
jgi:hypothetical protein